MSFLAYRANRQKLHIQYSVFSRAKILQPDTPQSVAVMVDSVEVSSPSLMTLRILNTGDRAIDDSHFVAPLHIKFVGASSIAQASVTQARPPSVNVDLDIDGDTVKVQAALLNPKDIFEVQVISSGFPESIEVDGRLRDVRISESLLRKYARPNLFSTPSDYVIVFPTLPLLYFMITLFILPLALMSIPQGQRSGISIPILATALLIGIAHSVFLVKRARLWQMK
ncbi:hypothetical protein Kisp02_57800 [Kineosporia sp. NBRC 101731]|nr:hypothetical protein Kisp02_57800 [Kineosporia sp. NBRC 101731]